MKNNKLLNKLISESPYLEEVNTHEQINICGGDWLDAALCVLGTWIGRGLKCLQPKNAGTYNSFYGGELY